MTVLMFFRGFWSNRESKCKDIFVNLCSICLHSVDRMRLTDLLSIIAILTGGGLCCFLDQTRILGYCWQLSIKGFSEASNGNLRTARTYQKFRFEWFPILLPEAGTPYVVKAYKTYVINSNESKSEDRSFQDMHPVESLNFEKREARSKKCRMMDARCNVMSEQCKMKDEVIMNWMLIFR